MIRTEVYHTARIWNELGFLIKTGQRSHQRSLDGTAMFSRSQVRRKNPRYWW